MVGIVLAIATAQGAVLFLYHLVDERRKEANESSFQYERLSEKPASDILLLSPDGSTRRLSELRGRPVLLHFWATWCPPCKEELPGLLGLSREISHNGELLVVALAMDEDWDAVRDFFGGEIPPEVVRVGTGSSADDYEVSNLPDTYLLDADGLLRLRFSGTRNWQSKLARDTLRKTAGTE